MLHHQKNGIIDSIRELIFGLEDGLVSTLGVVIGVAAGSGDRLVVLLSGLVLVVVEALSMAAGSFLSSKSHRQLLEMKIREEEREIDTKPDEEREELRGMYRLRGFNEDEIEIIVRRVTADKKLWLEEMVAKELRIGTTDLETPPVSAAVMGLAYIAGGIVPVAPFFFLPVSYASLAAIVSTVAVLFLVGAWKAKVTGTRPLDAGLEMVVVSAAAAAVGYGIGAVVGNVFGISVR